MSLLLLFLPSAAAEPGEDARRLSAILDYVAADYAGAVAGGAVTDPEEYEEQLAFLTDAADLAARLPASGVDVAMEVARLRGSVEGREGADAVAADARRLRAAVLDAYGVVLVPSAVPSRENGARLYAEQCAGCHGATGGADTPAAATMDPPPRSFRDAEVMAGLTPARAFNTVTDGVKGTAMPSFGQLSATDRWDLAFAVFTLRHDAAAEARGAAVTDSWEGGVPSLAALSGASDGELLASASGRMDALAWLRGVATYRQAERGAFALARESLDSAVTALGASDRVEARQQVSAAYLDGFEPHEAALRQVDARLVARVEEAFLFVRSRIDAGAAEEEVVAEVRRTQALLDDAELRLQGARGSRVAFVGALLVLLREGLEAALLLLLLLGFARPRGTAAVRSVHAGWLAAVGVGIVTWWASGRLVTIAGSSRELLEGAITLVAAAVMVTAHHWLVAAADAERRVEDIRATLGGPASAWTLGLLAFGAVYREAFEVVLFLQAIALDGGTGTGPVLAGGAAGLALLAVVVAAFLRLGRRIRPAPLLTGAGMLLCAMAVVFAGKGLRALQEAGVVPIHPFGGVRLDALGVYPTLETIGAQAALVIALVLSAAWPRGRRAPEAGGSEAAK
ncbi:MAG: c-type cytochrome [Myxococcota bacterium]